MTDNIVAWVGIIGAIVAIILPLLMRKPQTENLNAQTVKSLYDSISAANKNYSDLYDEFEQFKKETRIEIEYLKKSNSDLQIHNRALIKQIAQTGEIPVSMQRALVDESRR